MSSTPGRARIKELLLGLALVFSSWGLWRPGRALRRGRVGPWYSLELTLSVADLPYSKPLLFPVIFSTFHTLVFPLESLSCDLPLSQQSYLFSFTFLISCGSALQTISPLFYTTSQFLQQPQPRLCSWVIPDLSWTVWREVVFQKGATEQVVMVTQLYHNKSRPWTTDTEPFISFLKQKPLLLSLSHQQLPSKSL